MSAVIGPSAEGNTAVARLRVLRSRGAGETHRGGHSAHSHALGAEPTPNEPVGLAAVSALARYVVTSPHARRCSWYLLPCIDPDGARLNATWWSTGTPTLESYHRRFFRQAEADQPDWGLPRAGFDAVLTEGRRWPTPSAVPLPTAWSATTLTAGARSACPPRPTRRSCRSWSRPPPGMGCRWRPSRRTRSSGPHPAPASTSCRPPNRCPRRPAEDAARHLEDTAAVLAPAAALLTPRAAGPFLPAITDRLGIHAQVAAAYRRNPQAGAGQDLAHLGPLRTAGMVLRALDAELAHGSDAARASTRDEVEGHFVWWLAAAEQALRPEPIPLSRTAGFQLDMILSAGDLAAG